MLKIHKTPKTSGLKRRDFLSRSAAVSSMAILSSSVSPIHATEAVTRGLKASCSDQQIISAGNATIEDFADLMGQGFRLCNEDGTTLQARLIEAYTPSVGRALRFRRAHFSIVFDVPGEVELTQGRYRLSHSQIESMDLFMVPVDLPAKYNRLEAVFT